jgi:prepilin-type N-terminal cleavage/methylation domain-containing protein
MSLIKLQKKIEAEKKRSFFSHSLPTTNYPLQPSRGFSLIEMMVASSVFAMVMLMAVGALLSIVDSSRKAQSQETSFVNIDFALETMSRAIRLGTNYHCDVTVTSPPIIQPRDNLAGCTSVVFEAFSGSSANPNDQVVYRLNANRIERSVNSGGTYTPLTSPDVTIQNLSFYVMGSTPGDGSQARVLITVYGFAGTGKSQVNFNLQTTVTQRLLDI